MRNMKIDQIIATVGEAGLSLPGAFQHESPEDLARHYNGVGADWFPDWLRRRVTTILERMEPLAFIHDVEFGTSPRNYFAFTTAQIRWAYNALLLAMYQYKEKRLRFLAAAWLCAAACQLGGRRGYMKGLRK